MQGIRHESRISFKHPVIGLALVVVPLQALASDPLGLWWLSLASPLRLVGSFFMFWFGVYLLWGVARRRDERWVVFIVGSSERAFRLKAGLPPEAAALLDALCSDSDSVRLEA